MQLSTSLKTTSSESEEGTELLKHFSRNVKYLLFMHDMRPSDLIRKSHVTGKTVYELLNNHSTRISFTTLARIAKALEVSPDELFKD